jgi:hypothetical protein
MSTGIFSETNHIYNDYFLFVFVKVLGMSKKELYLEHCLELCYHFVIQGFVYFLAK